MRNSKGKLVQLIFILWMGPWVSSVGQAGVAQMVMGHQDPTTTRAEDRTEAEVTVIYEDADTSIESMKQRAVDEAIKEGRDYPDSELELVVIAEPREAVREQLQHHIKMAEAVGEARHISPIVAEAIAPSRESLEAAAFSQSYLYSGEADRQLIKQRATIVLVRMFNAGAVVSSVMFFANHLSWRAALAGGVAAALMSGELMRLDDRYNRYLGGRPLWDKAGKLTGREGKPIFKLLSVPGPYIRHASVIAGYMFVVHWFSVAFGAPADHAAAPAAWMMEKAGLAVLSAVTVGQWRQVLRTMFNRSMLDNGAANFGDPEAGVARAKRIKLRSWTAAVGLSAVGIALDALGLGEATASLAPYAMIAVGTTGVGALAWLNSDMPGTIKSFRVAQSNARARTSERARAGLGQIKQKIGSRCSLLFGGTGRKG